MKSRTIVETAIHFPPGFVFSPGNDTFESPLTRVRWTGGRLRRGTKRDRRRQRSGTRTTFGAQFAFAPNRPDLDGQAPVVAGIAGIVGADFDPGKGPLAGRVRVEVGNLGAHFSLRVLGEAVIVIGRPDGG